PGNRADHAFRTGIRPADKGIRITSTVHPADVRPRPHNRSRARNGLLLLYTGTGIARTVLSQTVVVIVTAERARMGFFFAYAGVRSLYQRPAAPDPALITGTGPGCRFTRLRTRP